MVIYKILTLDCNTIDGVRDIFKSTLWKRNRKSGLGNIFNGARDYLVNTCTKYCSNAA